jgi:uncharacterized protein
MMRLILVAFLLAACAGPPPARYLLEPLPVEGRVAVRPATIEVRDVRLPDHAAAPEITVPGPDGALRQAEGALWGDDPGRAVTLALARDLGRLTTAQAIAEPWPLADLADMRLDLRVERLVPRPDGTLHFSGQAIVSANGGDFRDVVERFDIVQPIESPGVPGIAAAHAAAVLALARQIAARLR